MTGRITRYDWLLQNLEEHEERTRLTEERDHFFNNKFEDETANSQANYSRIGLSFELDANRLHKITPELGRAFVWQASKYGVEYWDSVSNKYFDKMQEEVRGRIRNVIHESKAQVAVSNASEHESRLKAGWAAIEKAEQEEEQAAKERIADAERREAAKAAEANEKTSE